MQFTLQVNCDNESFQEGGSELATILRFLAYRFYNDGYCSDSADVVLDCNGNIVGDYSFSEKS